MDKITWPLLIVPVAVYYVTLLFYRLLLHPLARFPGPRLAAVSRWYEAYYDVIQGGQYTPKIAELHRIYGPIIRISPHELHIIDSSFFNMLYRMDGRWDKYSWTYDAFGAKRSTVFGSGHDAHKAHRNAIAPFFSKSNILARQNSIRKNTGKICMHISEFVSVKTRFNLGAAISAFTRDNANEFILGKAYNEIELEDFGVGLSIASGGAGSFWRITKHVRWFGPALRSIPVGWMMKVADEGTKSFFRYLEQSENDTRSAMAAALSSKDGQVEKKTEKYTMIHQIMDSNLPPSDKTFARVHEEVATVTGAAYETTANTMRLILYHVYSDEKILRKLRKEFSSLPSSELLTLRELEHIPYLTAVLTEGLRLSPGISSRMARITDKDLFYDKWRIPAGTPVGMTTLLMHTDPELYPDPMSFNPDRWLHAKSGTLKAPDANFAPFSRGTRICLGMHLAWAEMYLLLSALVRQFDFSIEGATASDFELDMDNFGIGTRAGCNLLAHANLYKA